MTDLLTADFIIKHCPTLTDPMTKESNFLTEETVVLRQWGVLEENLVLSSELI